MIERKRIRELRAREDARFRAERPRSAKLHEAARASLPAGVPMNWMVSLFDHPPVFVAEGKGAYFTDVDGHRYLDMNLADTSMPFGYGLEPIAEAVAAQIRRGSQFLLPDETGIAVAEELARRFRLPQWQFTLAASSANMEAIRIARVATGREAILMFDGKYHGMLDDTAFELVDGKLQAEGAGLPKDAAARLRIVQFNDLEAVETALAAGDVACVITEPALTNIGVIAPEPGFFAGLREATRRHGCLLIIDEAHTNVCAFGGLTRAWNLEPDILVLGKAIGGGVAIGAYGMSAELGRLLEQEPHGERRPGGAFGSIAVGGTFFANALSLAAARVTLDELLTPESQARAAALGAKLSDGIEAAVQRRGLPWSAYRLFCRSGYCFAPAPPRNALEARKVFDLELTNLLRVYLANRGVWEAIYSASAAVSLAMEAADIDLYLAVLDQALDELTA